MCPLIRIGRHVVVRTVKGQSPPPHTRTLRYLTISPTLRQSLHEKNAETNDSIDAQPLTLQRRDYTDSWAIIYSAVSIVWNPRSSLNPNKIQGGATSLSHCKYSENSMTELRRNWWTSAMLYVMRKSICTMWINDGSGVFARWRHSAMKFLNKKLMTGLCSAYNTAEVHQFPYSSVMEFSEYSQWDRMDGGPVFCATL